MTTPASLLCVLSLAVASLSAAQAVELKPAPTPKSIAELDQQFGKIISEGGIPGAQLVVIENGAVTFSKGYGLADVAHKIPVTTETVFRAGSISKSFVGLSAMMLVEEGKLDLNAKLTDLAPEIAFKNKWEATDPVRLVHLMEHTTGFDELRFSQYLFDGKDMPLKRAIELYGPYESRWKPGTYTSYANAGPVIAAYVLEKVSAKSWADFTRARFFEPLGMSSAHWDKSDEFAGRLSKSYANDGQTEQPYMDIPGKPAGSLNVTANDLAKFVMMLMNRGNFDGHQLVKPESIDRAENSESSLAHRLGLKATYGLGNIGQPRGRAVFHGHDGGIDGFVASYAYVAERKSGYVLMVNSASPKIAPAGRLIIAYLERNWPKPEIKEIAELPETLKSWAGIYQSITPRVQMLAPLQAILEWVPVTLKDNHLAIQDDEVISVGGGQYQSPDRAAPRNVFAQVDGQAQLIGALNASRKVPLPELALKITYAAFYGVVQTFNIVFLLFWLVGLFTGKLAERGGILPRLVPTLAMLAMPSLLAALFIGLSDGGFSGILALGTQSPISITIFVLSWTPLVLGALSLLLGLTARGGTPGFVRAFAIASGILAVASAVYLWPYGWVGLKTWM